MSTKDFNVAFTRDYLNEEGQLAYGDIGLGLLAESPSITYRFLDTYRNIVTADQIEGITGLAVLYPHITNDTFSNGSQDLTLVARCGAGYDRIDVNACTEADVLVVNAPDAVRAPTAAAALMFILVLAKRLWHLDRLVREGRWDLRSSYMGIEPSGRTLGIIGLGNIGKELVRQVSPLNMRVLAYDPYVTPEQALHINVKLVSLETLLSESDFISIHCLLTDETRGLIGSRELALMKPTAYLINLARGPVVNHEALVDTLMHRRIAGAALDVFYQEPLPIDDPITKLDNVVLSPHWMAATVDVFRNAGISNIKGFLQVAKGLLPDYIVNREVIERPGFQAKLNRFRP